MIVDMKTKLHGSLNNTIIPIHGLRSIFDLYSVKPLTEKTYTLGTTN